MRKLKLQVQTTIDGFMAGTSGELDWAATEWSDDLKNFVIGLTGPVDTILLGKNLAMGFIPYWTAALNEPVPAEGAKIFVETPKIVFSSTLHANDPVAKDWKNTGIENGDYIEKINALKNETGGDIIVYGGGKFVASLLKANLIDELNLFINPVAIGKGMPIFSEIESQQKYALESAKQFVCGITVLTYTKL